MLPGTKLGPYEMIEALAQGEWARCIARAIPA